MLSRSIDMSITRYALLVVVFISTIILASAVPSSPAAAIASDPKMFVSGDNTFYGYARAGEKISANFVKSSQVEPLGLGAHVITVSLEGPGLERQTCTINPTVATGAGCGFTDVIAPETGVYKIDFALPNDATVYDQVSPTVRWGRNMFSWNITIKDTADAAKAGRVWSELYAIRQPIQPEFATDLLYYYMSEDGYLYRATYKGYNGQISTLSADAFGIRQNKTCRSAYQSIQVDDTKLSPSFGECGGSYKLFFEQPAGELPQSAKRWDGKTEWVSPAINRPVIDGLKFDVNSSSDMQSGNITYVLKNYIGQYDIKIDTNDDGNFDATEDIKITHKIDKLTSDKQQIAFDGINGDGQPIPKSQKIRVKIDIARVAEIHLVNADVEGRTGGIELVRLSGDNAPTYRVCWNDTQLRPIANKGLETPKVDGRECPLSQGGVHGWAYGTDSWGDVRYIDNWIYASARVDGVAEIKYPSDQTEVAGVSVNRQQKQIIAFAVIGVVAVLAIIGAVVGVKIHNHRKLMKQFQPPKF